MTKEYIVIAEPYQQRPKLIVSKHFVTQIFTDLAKANKCKEKMEERWNSSVLPHQEVVYNVYEIIKVEEEDHDSL